MPGWVPEVWSFGKSMIIRFGSSPFSSYRFNSPRNWLARNWSETMIGKPVAVGQIYGSSVLIAAVAFTSILPAPLR